MTTVSPTPNIASAASNTDAETVNHQGVTDATARSAATGDPLVLGLPLISVGAAVLGLQQVGYVNIASVGSPLAVIVAASGLGLLLATIWAIALDTRPASSPWDSGKSLVTVSLGAVGLFFLSYGALVLGLLHSWYGIKPADVAHTESAFQIAWLLVFVLLAIVSVRLPALFTVLFVAFSAVFVALLVGTLAPSQAAGRVAGVIVLVIAVSAGYVFVAVSSAASGGREHPLGPPLRK